MRNNILCIIITVFLLTCFSTIGLCGMTADDIVKKVAEQNFKDSFRVALTIETFKGQKSASTQALWISGKLQKDVADFFFDFDEPKESKGLRFLLQIRPNQDPKVYMYLPATEKTLPVVSDDGSFDIGGTGLNTGDILGFVPRAGEKHSIVREEKFDGQDCWVIQTLKTEKKGEHFAWVRKSDFTVVKSEDLDANNKTTRSYRVIKFFKTQDGREFPREEEIKIPKKNTRILVRQDHAVFGIELANELFDPEKFGIFKWKN